MKMLIKIYKQLAKVINNRHDQSKVFFSHQLKYCLTVKKVQQLSHLRRGGSSTQSSIVVLGVISIMLLVLPLCCVDASGYSYSRFVGPVSGPEHKVFVDDTSSGADGRKQHRGSDALRLDYVGKPEYDFAYGVEDADTRVLHNRNEMRDGDAVKGVYSLIDPDGTLRVVKYTADDVNGFRAQVERNKLPALRGEIRHDYTRDPPPKTITYNHDGYQNTKNEYQPHYPQSHIHIKNNRVAYGSPSSNGRKPNVEQMPQNMHEKTSQPHIVYHYNKKYGHNGQYDSSDANGSNESDNRYHENKRPHYEVHEKTDDDSREDTDKRPQYKVHEKPDDELYDENGNAYKSSIFVKAAAHKKKKHHRPAYDDDDDDDDDDEEYYSDDDSDELDDFDEAVQAPKNSEESNEYY